MYIFQQDGDYVNFNGGGNLWRLHKDSNCIAWHWDETGDLFFDVYDQAYVVKAANIGTVTVGGVTLTTAADFGTEIVNVFTGLASSPGGSSILSASVTLTDAQIKALPTLGFEILAAQGSGKMAQIVALNLSFRWTADYTIDGDEILQCYYNNSGAEASNSLSDSSGQVTDLFGNGSSSVAVLSGYQLAGGAFMGVVKPRVDYNNDPIYLYIVRGGGVFTGGDAANTLKVTVYYVVVDL